VSCYKPYPRYKESGIAWLGEVPEHWKIQKLKYIAHTQPSNVDKKSKENEQNVLLCNYTDVYKNEFITNEIDFMKATATYEQIKKFKLEVDDVIITKDSEGPEDIAIAAYVKETQNDLICGYHLTQIKPKNCNGVYLYRAFNSSGIHDQFKVAANGITRYGLSVYAIDNALFPVPPKQEQTTIANFLDRETAKIDTLIVKQERLIALLAEKRQALISHAVTKGLDPNVKMKDSGVEWIGMIPAHWDVKSLKALLQERKETNKPIKTTNILSLCMYRGVIPYAEKGNSGNKAKEDLTAYKLAYPNDIVLNSMNVVAGSVGLSQYYGAVSPVYYMLRPRKHIDNVRYFNSIFQSESFQKSLIGLGNGILVKQSEITGKLNTIRMRIPMEKLNTVPLPYPSPEEQSQIVEFINQETKKIETLTEKAKQAIILLKERRTALISATVTGKIDVRGEVRENVLGYDVSKEVV